MSSEATPTVLVLVNALMLAQSSGASEIGIDHLLAALDRNVALDEPVVPSDGPFVPVANQDLPLSTGAAAAIGSLEEIPSMPLDLLRSVLLAAKARGAH